MDEQIGMDRATFENRYLWNIKLFGQFIGLWPYQEKSKKYFGRGFTTVFAWTCICTQIAYVVKNFSMNTLSEQIPFLLLGIGGSVKHSNYALNEKRIKILLNVIISDFLAKRPKEEMEILESCINRAIFFGNIYKVTLTTVVIGYLTLPALPRVLDIIAPLNKSRDRAFLFPAYYFVDEQRFYFPIVIHMMICACLAGTVFICCDVYLTHLVQHACALLGISGYRFKHAMEALDLHDGNTDFLERNYAAVVDSIKLHKKASQFVKIFDEVHIFYFLIILSFVMVAFTIDFLKLTMLEMGSVFITFAMFTVAQLVHISYLASMAQFLSNANDELYETVCQADWYKGSKKTQALFVLVLRKCLFPLKLTAGGVIELNLACCVQILKGSFSYYTVLKNS